jgi:hypothetical protein
MSDFLAVAGKFPLAGGGAVAILSVFIYAILAGRLVPRSAVDDVRADRDARLAEIRRESDDWRSAWQASQETNKVLADQNKELLELSRTTHQLIKALPGPAVTKEPTP